MKKTIAFLLIVVLAACQDIETLEKETSLGSNPESTDITSLVVESKQATIVAKTTVGAKYSVQVYKFGNSEQPLKTVGFTATSVATIKTIQLDTLSRGLYDLTLTDVSGVTIKKPLIIN
jgi:hypothetical protein